MTFEGGLYDRGYFEGLHKSHWFTNPKRKYEERNRDTLRVVEPGTLGPHSRAWIGARRRLVLPRRTREGGRGGGRFRRRAPARGGRPGEEGTLQRPVREGGRRGLVGLFGRLFRGRRRHRPRRAHRRPDARRDAVGVPARARPGRSPRPLHARPRALRRTSQGARGDPEAIPAAHRGPAGPTLTGVFSWMRDFASRSTRTPSRRFPACGGSKPHSRPFRSSERRSATASSSRQENRDRTRRKNSRRTRTSTDPSTTRGCTGRTGS